MKSFSFNRRPWWLALRLRGLGLCAVLTTLAACSGAVINSEPAYAAPPNTVTTVALSKVDRGACDTAPVTFGQPFRPGDLPRGQTLQAQVDGHTVPTQVDIKARNRDGSARHAVVTINVPCRAAEKGARVALVRTGTPQSSAPLGISDVLQSAFDARFNATINGEAWTADARQLLERIAESGSCKAANIYCRRWLDGPLVSEWVVGAPLTDGANRQHPHLATYFAVRAYGPAPVRRVRVDIVAENDWAYVGRPQHITYDAELGVAGGQSMSFKGLKHYRQARWHRAFWWGENNALPVYAALDPAYMQSTPAVPQYEDIRLSRRLAHEVRQECPPMRSCDISKRMEKTGAQDQIGPLPRWSSAYLVDTDYRIYRWMLANSDALGSYEVHFRDQETGEPLSLVDYPCATTLWPARTPNCAVSPKGDHRFPNCKGDCKSPLNADESHHPAPAYAAYLATGDWYYQMEMSFWADWVVLSLNPGYRDYANGLVHRTQLRGQAWGLRTLADAAYLLPDDAKLKEYFNDVVAANIAWYNEHYSHNPDANKLGAIAGYHSVVYSTHAGKRTGVSSWQQSFFTWAAGNLADMGFAGAPDLRDWVSKFQIDQMTAPGYCFELASAYKLQVRDSSKAPIYDTFAKVYEKTFPELLEAGCERDQLNAAITRMEGRKRFHYPPGSMVGYPSNPTGFVANFQIGLAAAANARDPNAGKAWEIFSKRSTPTDFSSAPQFSVVPTSHTRP